MQLSPSPDLGPMPRLLTVAAFVALVVCAILAWLYPMTARLGDTDDAMRLVMVRDLLAGRGWYDQAITRLQPPSGLYMHWSRLLDGGIAGLTVFLRLFMAPAPAEWCARFLWPLAWVFPAVTCALLVARNLGGRAAVLLTAPLLMIDLPLYRQFIPGRIDHHNIQIVMTMAALAGAVAKNNRARWGCFAGVAAAFGLAIGLEALPLQALIGASFGVSLVRDRKDAPAAAAYGLCLAGASLIFFAAQTPPWRWSLTFCDALAFNLVAALVTAGLGLALAAWAARAASIPVRVGSLVIVAVAAAGAYLWSAPRCIHGPFADMNPAVRPFWFNTIQEVQPLPRMLGLAREPAVVAITMMIMALSAGVYLLGRWRGSPSTSALLMGGALIGACITAYFTWRMQDYVFWIGMPAIGAAYSLIAARRLRDLMAPSLAAATILAPTFVGAAASKAVSLAQAAGAVAAPPRQLNLKKCFDPRLYRALAALPPGVVLSEQDLGPFILAFTRHSALVAPYHRMSDEILKVHQAWNAPPARAETAVRGLGATYVIDCPPYPMAAAAGTFGARLRAGETPPWLLPLSPPGAPLRIFRVRPASPAAS